MTAHDLNDSSAALTARLIRDGEISCHEAVSASLARIDAVNGTLNCFCFTYPDEALAKAKAADKQRQDGKTLGPLHGVPYALKDFTPTKGKTTTRGSRIFADWVPDFDPVIKQRLEAAGAILVGKTTTPEFAYDGFTHSPLWGHTRNPWNPAHTPGGSSGGSGAAVASGCVPIAEGTDMGGSVRIPAAFCGIAGLKPSLGRIPMDILPTVFDSISHFGPLARRIEDIALFMEVTAGPDEADIQSLPRGAGPSLPLPSNPSDWRIALSIDLGYYAVDDEMAAHTYKAADALRAAGAQVSEVDLNWRQDFTDAWFEFWGVYLAAAFGEYLPEWRDKMDPNVVGLMEAGLKMDAVSFKRIENLRTEQWNHLRKVFTGHHALLCPTMALPAPEIGGSDGDFGQTDAQGRYHGLDMTSAFNFVPQCPALSLPSGFTKAGLPTAVQIVGRRYDDDGVLEIGKVIEAALGSALRPDL